MEIVGQIIAAVVAIIGALRIGIRRLSGLSRRPADSDYRRENPQFAVEAAALA